MDFQEYDQLNKQAVQLLSSGKYKEAWEMFHSLYMSDIADIDKAAICIRMAIIQDRIGSSDEVLAWYDKGIAYEEPFFRYRVCLEKVHYLADLGRCMEAVPILEGLLKQPYVSEVEKEAFRKEIKILLSKSIGQWK